MPHLPVLFQIACVSQVQAELQNKKLTALEEVKLLKARGRNRSVWPCSSACMDWLAFHCKVEKAKLEGKMRSAQKEATHVNWHYVLTISV